MKIRSFDMRKIMIAGGNGFLGKLLQGHFQSRGDEIIVLTREEKSRRGSVTYVKWNGRDIGPWSEYLENCDVLINLAGRSVNCRYNDKNKNEIYASREESTRVLGEALKLIKNKRKVWLNSASATIYKSSYDRANDEASGIIGDGFSVDVCQRWEKAFFDSKVNGVRQVAMRTAMVVGRGGPFLELMTKIVRLRLGGRRGSGRQMVSWLHEADWIAGVEFLIAHEELEGAVNLAAPNPIPNNYLMQQLRRVCGVKLGLPAYTWMVHLGAVLMGTEPELPLKSRYVIPGRLLKAEYTFQFDQIDKAFDDLVP